MEVLILWYVAAMSLLMMLQIIRLRSMVHRLDKILSDHLELDERYEKKN